MSPSQKRKPGRVARQSDARPSVPVRLVVVPAAELPAAELRGPGRPTGVLDARPRSKRVLAVLLLLLQKKTVGEVAVALQCPYATVYGIRERWLHRKGLQLALPTG